MEITKKNKYHANRQTSTCVRNIEVQNTQYKFFSTTKNYFHNKNVHSPCVEKLRPYIQWAKKNHSG